MVGINRRANSRYSGTQPVQRSVNAYVPPAARRGGAPNAPARSNPPSANGPDGISAPGPKHGAEIPTEAKPSGVAAVEIKPDLSNGSAIPSITIESRNLDVPSGSGRGSDQSVSKTGLPESTSTVEDEKTNGTAPEATAGGTEAKVSGLLLRFG